MAPAAVRSPSRCLMRSSSCIFGSFQAITWRSRLFCCWPNPGRPFSHAASSEMDFFPLFVLWFFFEGVNAPASIVALAWRIRLRTNANVTIPQLQPLFISVDVRERYYYIRAILPAGSTDEVLMMNFLFTSNYLLSK